jgi:hypothetical protein
MRRRAGLLDIHNVVRVGSRSRASDIQHGELKVDIPTSPYTSRVSRPSSVPGLETGRAVILFVL